VKIYTFLNKNLINFLIALAILFSPLIVNYADLPKGYEIPKVVFWQYFPLGLLTIATIFYLINSIRAKKPQYSKDILVVIFLAGLFLLITQSSPYKDIALYGNSFRFQGLITHLIFLILGYLIYKFANRKGFHLFAIAFISSGILQSYLAFDQFFNLVQTDPQAILTGYYINGSFGQSNFFAGRIFLGIIFSFYYLIKPPKIIGAWLTRILTFLSILVMMVALILSQSIWGVVTTIFAVVLIFLYEILSSKNFVRIVGAGSLIALVAGVYVIMNISTYNIRLDMWKNVIDMTLGESSTARSFFFGFGFDTLGDAFRSFGRFRGLFVDRAHNFFLDLLAQGGVSLLTSISALIIFLISKMRKNINDRIFMVLTLASVAWLFRSFVNESGIINLVDFVILFAAAFGIADIKHKMRKR
jgi:O-antigen ligase